MSIEQYKSGTFCTAGVNYVVLAPNGNAYHCMTDLEADRAPAFNLKTDGWSPKSSLYRCPYPGCSGCDAPYVTRWTQDDMGQTETTHDRSWLAYQKEDPETPGTIAKSLTWLPTQICNFTCVYCDYGNGKAFTHSRYPMSKNELTTEEWMAAWSEILDNVDYAAVSISGGEPVMSDAFMPVIEMISSRYLINLTTNGSQNYMKLLPDAVRRKTVVDHPRLGRIQVGFDQINISLHPTSKTFQEQQFKGNVLMLKDAGYKVSVNMVGYPPQLFLAEEYKEWCDKYDIRFLLLEWGMGDRFGAKPAYTKSQRDYLDSLMTHGRRVLANDAPDYRHTIILENSSFEVARNTPVTIKGEVRNESSFVWKSGAEGFGVKVGMRSFQKSIDEGWRGVLASRKGETLVTETRYDFSPRNIEIGGIEPFTMTASFDIPGVYECLVDVVDEGVIWFSSAGATSLTVTVRVTE